MTYQVSHRIATLLKAELHPDVRWQTFSSHCTRTQASGRQTDLSFLLPPSQRTKARFMRVDTHVEWVRDFLTYYERRDFSAIRPTCVLTVAARDRLGVARVRPPHTLPGHRHPATRRHDVIGLLPSIGTIQQTRYATASLVSAFDAMLFADIQCSGLLYDNNASWSQQEQRRRLYVFPVTTTLVVIVRRISHDTRHAVGLMERLTP